MDFPVNPKQLHERCLIKYRIAPTATCTIAEIEAAYDELLDEIPPHVWLEEAWKTTPIMHSINTNPTRKIALAAAEVNKN
jgi:hypothetical protein